MASSIGCMECESVREQFMSNQPIRHVIAVHVTGIHHVSTKKSKGRKGYKDPRSIRENRHVMRNHVHKVVCALQNSSGGVALVHLAQQDPDDRYLGYFDEFINPIFQNVSEDGRMPFERYTRRWLCDAEEFREFQEFVCLTVTPLGYVSTVEFNTKVRNDVESTEPSLRCLLRCLEVEHCVGTAPRVRGLHGDMFENRNIELKSWKYGTEDLHNAKDMAEFIWYKLRMRENITSMSKIPEGGSMFVGIDERTVERATYRTVELSYGGVPRTFPQEELRREFQHLALKHLVVLSPTRKFEDAPEDLFRLSFHDVDKDNFVLEISIRYVPGIVFHDKSGPRSYKIDGGLGQPMAGEGEIVRMKKTDWVERLPAWGH